MTTTNESTRKRRRRTILSVALALVGAPVFANPTPSATGAGQGVPGSKGASPAPAAKGPLVEVWKAPDCGCCADWVTHLERNGFIVEVNNVGNTAMRAKLGLPSRYGSCHTARVGGYVIEGHVPAREITRLLAEKPQVIGLAVPGMPIGSPGMDGGPYGDRKDPYDVLLVQRDGTSKVFHAYR